MFLKDQRLKNQVSTVTGSPDPERKLTCSKYLNSPKELQHSTGSGSTTKNQ